MLAKNINIRIWSLIICLAIFSLGYLSNNTTAQTNPNEQDRDMRRKFRETPTEQKTVASKKAIKKSIKKDTPEDIEQLIGVTLWRLVDSKDAPSERELKYKAAEITSGLVAERIDPNTLLSKGEKIRLTIEVPREGYLYVIDQEQYENGILGEPILLFPITKILGGNNKVKRGYTVGIPSLTDNPSYFELERSRSDHIAERISVIVTSKPIKDLSIPDSPTKISRSEFENWQKWETQVETLQIDKQTKFYTSQERLAETTNKANKELKYKDPLPQTIYKATTKSNDGVMINIPLKLGAK